jgi:transcription elongation factor GreA
MAEERFVLTRAGYEQLQDELKTLQERRQGAMDTFADMSDYWDIDPSPEEAAYVEARTTKEQLDERIGHLTLVLRHAEVVDDDADVSAVATGCRVTVWDVNEKRELQFDVLGSEEVTHGRHGVSAESPVGKRLLGCKAGDVIEVVVPDGMVHYAIRKIERIPAGTGA